ncbi:NUC173-domain-containing protein [Viridothelium virens]|uniref:NUC173-domain-containing protein n=1 Tax=Viridothelium virens TaxID=1048519 RepID=A0A6A6HFC2_VIRVR|nr:NUC173-domain-containing protein [Viridothelium virens]
MSLEERLDKIRSSPKLQNQQYTAVILNAVDETLRGQNSKPTPTAYLAALLSLLNQYINAHGTNNKDLAHAVVYLLDLLAPHVPPPLLRSKFPQILNNLASPLTHVDSEAPILKASIGCLESLLVQQDSQAWHLPVNQTSPRGAIAGLLQLAVDRRPKVRKRAHDALIKVLQNPPPSPSVDHPAADMCAEYALRSLKEIAEADGKQRKHHGQREEQQKAPELVHAMQLVRTIATASGGWPSRKIDSLCELLLNIAKSSNQYLTMTTFDVFEVIFSGMANEESSPKLPRLIEVIEELQPSRNDSELLPPWIAVLSRAYDVSSQVVPEDTFQKLPEVFASVAGFLDSPSHNIRVSASECLISLFHNCIPHSVVLEPSIFDEKVLEKIAKTLMNLLSVKYQSAWMEVFNVLSSAFDALRWRSSPLLAPVIKVIGDLRANDAFSGKKEADAVLVKAIHAAGPDNIMDVLPLNLAKPAPDRPGRAWLLPLVRDAVHNTRLSHFRSELVPLSEAMFQRVLNHGAAEKTMEIKIFETIVNQVWSCFPGYCDLPLDLINAFDQNFAELISNLLYQQTDLRVALCQGLQNLVESNQATLSVDEESDLSVQTRVTKENAKENIRHLGGFAGNMLAVLFNVYSQTLPQYRGPILTCINAYLSITPEQELTETLHRVTVMLENSIAEEAPKDHVSKTSKPENRMPATSHTLMDLLVVLSPHLTAVSLPSLLSLATKILLSKDFDPALKKKAYKFIPRIASSPTLSSLLTAHSTTLQQLVLDSAPLVVAQTRRDRLAALKEIVQRLPENDLWFIPAVLPEVVISAKEINQRAREAGFDVLVTMGERMSQGGVVKTLKVPGLAEPIDQQQTKGDATMHIDQLPSQTTTGDGEGGDVPASLDEYITMLSAGLAGSSPHTIAATITSLSRVLFTFHGELSHPTLTDLLDTVSLFLSSSPNREIVRSTLGFIKVAIVALPNDMMGERLSVLVPTLCKWAREQKERLKMKVKNILERMVRIWGFEAVEKWTPEEQRKLLANIRKIRDRRKRRKEAGKGEMEDEDEEVEGVEAANGNSRKKQFESEFDEAVYGSEDEEEIDEGEMEIETGKRGKRGKTERQAYIHEEEDEPLDLLDRKALGNISTTKPLQRRQPPAQRMKAKVNLDGKLLLGDDESDDDEEMQTFDDAGNVEAKLNANEASLEAGIDAYVSAIRGKDAGHRGQKGKLKFKQKGREDHDEMEVDARQVATAQKQKVAMNVNRGNPTPSKVRTERVGKGSIAKRAQRPGLGATKMKHDGVGKKRGGRDGRTWRS